MCMRRRCTLTLGMASCYEGSEGVDALGGGLIEAEDNSVVRAANSCVMLRCLGRHVGNMREEFWVYGAVLPCLIYWVGVSGVHTV